VTLTHEEVQRAFQPVVEELLTALRELLEQTPPDLAEDVRETGILLTGGGSLLTGLAETIQEAIGIPVTVAPDPELAVILGLEATLPHLSKRKDGPLDFAKLR
jgi:rod shape-determining protein MreB